MKIRWFLPGLIGFLCMASPAMAGELASWRFDPTENSLEFTTDEGVQPRAQLVPDPTRLVIDLPGTLMGDVQRSQFLSGAFRQIRIGQWDANTTRIVVELAPGYMLDPQQVSFRGISPTQWTVQLPSPEYVGAVANSQTAPSPSSMTPTPTMTSPSGLSSGSTNFPHSSIRSSVASSPAPAPIAPVSPTSPASPSPPSPDTTLNSLTPASATVDDSVTQIELMQVTDDGLFLRTTGETPEIDRVNRSRDRRSITITLENAVLSSQLTQEMAIEQFGVERLQFKQVEQDDDEPPTVEITLEVDRDSPNWNATVSGLGGIVLLPRERVARRSNSRTSDSRNAESRSAAEEDSLAESSTSSQTVSALPVATIEGIDLDPSGTQLLIHSDRPVTYTGQWQSGMYQVRLSPAHLAAQVTGPQLDANSPLLRVRLRQEDDETVVVMIQPASGIRFGALNLVSPQLLSLEMERSRSTPTATSTLPVAATNQTFQQNSSVLSFPTSGSMAGASSSRIPSGQIVIVIDPGHGGADVGAVGVGNIHEADVVLPVAQQVGALLQQQGVQVVMTRNDDREIDLEPRVQMAEQANATLFVSIHANSMGMDRPDVNGTETYYYSNGAGLAQVIQDSIVGALDMNDRGIKQARFYVLRRTTMPAVLVEIGYVTGSEDGRRLGDGSFQSQMARAIAQGILQYIQSMASQ